MSSGQPPFTLKTKIWPNKVHFKAKIDISQFLSFQTLQDEIENYLSD